MNAKEMSKAMMQMGESLKVLRQQRDVAEDAAQALQSQVESLQMEVIETREQRDRMAYKLQNQKREAHWQRLNDRITQRKPYPWNTQHTVCERLGF